MLRERGGGQAGTGIGMVIMQGKLIAGVYTLRTN